MKKTVRPLALFVLPISLLVFISYKAAAVFSASSNVVISEIQISGANSTTDEFVELYNASSSDVDLTDYKLTRKTSGGTESVLIEDLGGTIPAHGFYLLANENYTGLIVGDETYSGNIAVDNSVILYDSTGTTVVDKVGIGSEAEGEGGTYTSVPDDGRSVERKANASSTKASMESGADQYAGNGWDSDDNAANFIYRTTSEPQNFESSLEPVLSPTETPIPTETPLPTETPVPTATSAPTETPVPTETPAPTETPLPTATPIPTETPESTAVPTETPVATETPLPTETPVVSPTPAPSPEAGAPESEVLAEFELLGGRRLVCSVNYRPVRIFMSTIWFPHLSCIHTR